MSSRAARPVCPESAFSRSRDRRGLPVRSQHGRPVRAGVRSSLENTANAVAARAMAVETRPELVGKRFLCVAAGDEARPERGESGRCWRSWRAGVIRAVSHRDSRDPDLAVSEPAATRAPGGFPAAPGSTRAAGGHAPPWSPQLPPGCPPLGECFPGRLGLGAGLPRDPGRPRRAPGPGRPGRPGLAGRAPWKAGAGAERPGAPRDPRVAEGKGRKNNDRPLAFQRCRGTAVAVTGPDSPCTG